MRRQVSSLVEQLADLRAKLALQSTQSRSLRQDRSSAEHDQRIALLTAANAQLLEVRASAWRTTEGRRESVRNPGRAARVCLRREESVMSSSHVLVAPLQQIHSAHACHAQSDQ